MTELTRVVIVAPEDLPIPPTKGGSVQIYLHHLTKALAERPDLNLILLSPGKRNRSSTIPQVKVRGKRALYREAVLSNLRRLQPDVVQIDNRPDFVLLVKRNLPGAKVVLNLHSTTFLGSAKISPGAAKSVLQIADAVVMNSQDLQREIERRFRLQQGQWRRHVVYPGVSLNSTEPSGMKPHHPLRILFVGRVIRQKGVHVLVNAVSRLSRQGVPVHLTIVGQTPPWERTYRIRVRQASKGLPIEWVGFVPPSRIAKYYSGADIFICPSQLHEAFGLVNVEAMAAGLPVIASRQGGIQEVVTEDSGILVDDYRSPSAFAKAIEMVIADPGHYEVLRKGALQRAAHFRWHETARRFAIIYASLADRNRKSVSDGLQPAQHVIFVLN